MTNSSCLYKYVLMVSDVMLAVWWKPHFIFDNWMHHSAIVRTPTSPSSMTSVVITVGSSNVILHEVNHVTCYFRRQVTSCFLFLDLILSYRSNGTAKHLIISGSDQLSTNSCQTIPWDICRECPSILLFFFLQSSVTVRLVSAFWFWKPH